MPDLCGLQPVARTLPRKHLMSDHPTTAGVDGDVGAFTPLPGWAERLPSERAPVAGGLTRGERTTTHESDELDKQKS